MVSPFRPKWYFLIFPSLGLVDFQFLEFDHDVGNWGLLHILIGSARPLPTSFSIWTSYLLDLPPIGLL